jgi:hypothetical protein
VIDHLADSTLHVWRTPPPRHTPRPRSSSFLRASSSYREAVSFNIGRRERPALRGPRAATVCTPHLEEKSARDICKLIYEYALQ